MQFEFTADELHELPKVLSAPRFGTYLRATNGAPHRALELYCWNAELSASFLIPIQFCEIALRNGAVEALEAVHGHNWHLARGFVRSLPRHKKGYQPQDDLRVQSSRLPTAGKVVAELRFAFWQFLFTKGQDERLWKPHLADCFPGYDRSLSIPDARAFLFREIEKVRNFRNRIAHHEPIFTRDLNAEYLRLRTLIKWRRPTAASWLDKVEQVSKAGAANPLRPQK